MTLCFAYEFTLWLLSAAVWYRPEPGSPIGYPGRR
jgi:hypothetical protein